MDNKTLGGNIKHEHTKLKIGFAGAADTSHLNEKTMQTCLEVGREIVMHQAVLISGATTGAPLWVCKGAKEAGGVSVGLSPAGSEREHVELYKLPIDYMDFIIYTGFGFVGRDMLMTRTSDAVIIGPGRVGTIHEFTVAFEDKKPLGILTGDDWETDEIIKMIIEKSHRKADNPFVVYDSDPKKLLDKVVEMAEKNKTEHYRIYRASDNFTYKCTDKSCEDITHNHTDNPNNSFGVVL